MASDSGLPLETTSLCPECLERVPGQYQQRDGAVELTRTCPEHGTHARRAWGSDDHWEWAAGVGPATEATGELAVTGDHACLAVVEVTQDCNLSCSFCYASSGPGGPQLPADAVIDRLETVIDVAGPRPVQFSGGEPTIREDLPDLIERAGDMGFEHVQVNTNGLRLAQAEGYADELAAAGVTAVYLQFDGLRASTYERIRDADILDAKHTAIEACRSAGLSVVLVPTVVPGVNDDELGDIVRFALANRDVIESINFQPVAHFGRFDKNDGRFPIDDAARLLADQVPELDSRDLLPVPCCSSYCQLATAVLEDDGEVIPLTNFLSRDVVAAASQLVDEADWLDLMASTDDGEDCACTVAGCCGVELPEDGWLSDTALTISITGFMDAAVADAGRLENCCITVPTPDGELAPFCGYNMTTEDGRYALRTRHGWGGRAVAGTPPVDGERTESHSTNGVSAIPGDEQLRGETDD